MSKLKRLKVDSQSTQQELRTINWGVKVFSWKTKSHKEKIEVYFITQDPQR